MKLGEICVGSRNKGKIVEINRILEPLGIKTVQPRPDIPDPEEPYMTFRENSAVKSIAFARAMDMPTLADDSGIVVPALSKRFGFPFPGVVSARQCLYRVEGNELVDFDPDRVPKAERNKVNNARLIRLMSDMTGEDRNAHYVISLTLADPSGAILFACEAISEIGRIIEEPRGENGFGHDPILYLPRFSRTFAELEAHEKDPISHRGRALRTFARWCQDVTQ
jgi:XTP/dITP diphosphohydrolase